MEVASDIRTVCDGTVDGSEGAGEEVLAQHIIGIGETVLGDVDGLLVELEFDQCLIDGLGRVIPAKVGLLSIGILVEAMVDDIAIVVVEADEILMKKILKN